MIDVERFKTLIFDVDGTLIDSNGAHAEAWVRAFHEQHVTIELQEVRRLIGMGGDKLIPAVAHVGEDSALGQAVTRRKKELFDRLLPALRPTNGARALLEYLRDTGIVLAIATSANATELQSLLARAGVAELFPARSSKDASQESKPDPDVVHAALSQAGARPERTLMVGDTPYDIEAARRAGVDAVAFRCGGYWSDDDLRGAVAIYDDPASLLERWRGAATPQRQLSR